VDSVRAALELLLERLTSLADTVKDVRVSSRLTTSPAWSSTAVGPGEARKK
jgi:hypothetical protein